ncbi:Thioester reductase domain-containing protein [Halovenus aranensis]|uniref:Thioester reductase domain-containing protein n=1 Tax=Halovenus aranensis TaxID=890420 RepID=A0A1G8YSQ8_9EURY|nr:SDR family oxidoreductase [Halovenus aranensis]SDK05882.1 Thioester reductase domain-containing protein [Halovenus aranensis]
MSEPRVFLTGFPGFLGSALLERLLDRGDGPVACLVQPRYYGRAEQRAAEIADDASIRLYEGDITEPDLGLGDAVDDFGSVTEVYHLAAVYDLAVEAEFAESVNVRGTEHVLDFAESCGVDRFQYVSTCYVSGRYDGVFTEQHLAEGQAFNNHYERTKFEAERLVQQRMDEGLPTTIYRPAIVVGDSETGETGKYDGPYYILRLVLAQPAACSVLTTLPGSTDCELNVVPRDFVVDAIAALSRRDDTVDEVYQLCDPAPLSVPALLDAVEAATGHRVISLPVPKSVTKRLMATLADRGWPAEPATVDYLDHPTRYACPNTRRALADTGIECPPAASYVDALVDFLREHPDVRSEAMS